jgi:hypothetical protein
MALVAVTSMVVALIRAARAGEACDQRRRGERRGDDAKS